MVNGDEKDFVSELSCEARPIEEIIVPRLLDGCDGKNRAVEYGYTNPIKQKSYVLGKDTFLYVTVSKDNLTMPDFKPKSSVSPEVYSKYMK